MKDNKQQPFIETANVLLSRLRELEDIERKYNDLKDKNIVTVTINLNKYYNGNSQRSEITFIDTDINNPDITKIKQEIDNHLTDFYKNPSDTIRTISTEKDKFANLYYNLNSEYQTLRARVIIFNKMSWYKKMFHRIDNCKEDCEYCCNKKKCCC